MGLSLSKKEYISKRLKLESEKKDLYDLNEQKMKEFNEYTNDMTHVFYTFAGLTKYAKKRQLYINKKELQIFLDIVCITTSVDDIMTEIDKDIIDNRITLNEWMRYFCEPKFNLYCFDIQEHIQSQTTWILLKKSLKIFDVCNIICLYMHT